MNGRAALTECKRWWGNAHARSMSGHQTRDPCDVEPSDAG